MNYKTDKIRARIVEKFGSQKAFAEAAGINETTLSKNLKNGIEWKGSNMMKAIKLLEIPNTEIDLYFFDPVVEKTQL